MTEGCNFEFRIWYPCMGRVSKIGKSYL